MWETGSVCEVLYVGREGEEVGEWGWWDYHGRWGLLGRNCVDLERIKKGLGKQCQLVDAPLGASGKESAEENFALDSPAWVQSF